MTIVTTAFLALATAQARLRNHKDLSFVVVTHPVGGLGASQLADRISEAVPQLQGP